MEKRVISCPHCEGDRTFQMLVPAKLSDVSPLNAHSTGMRFFGCRGCGILFLAKNKAQVEEWDQRFKNQTDPLEKFVEGEPL